MKLALLSTAALAAALLAGAAYAQDTSSSATTPSSAATEPSPAPAQDSPSAPSATTSATDASSNTRVITVTNGPIPDTPENRERFGGPKSAAGRASKPAGN